MAQNQDQLRREYIAYIESKLHETASFVGVIVLTGDHLSQRKTTDTAGLSFAQLKFLYDRLLEKTLGTKPLKNAIFQTGGFLTIPHTLLGIFSKISDTDTASQGPSLAQKKLTGGKPLENYRTTRRVHGYSEDDYYMR